MHPEMRALPRVWRAGDAEPEGVTAVQAADGERCDREMDGPNVGFWRAHHPTCRFCTPGNRHWYTWEKLAAARGPLAEILEDQ